jgi:hypothetical protein
MPQSYKNKVQYILTSPTSLEMLKVSRRTPERRLLRTLPAGHGIRRSLFALHDASYACGFVTAAAWLQGFKIIGASCACMRAYADVAY